MQKLSHLLHGSQCNISITHYISYTYEFAIFAKSCDNAPVVAFLSHCPLGWPLRLHAAQSHFIARVTKLTVKNDPEDVLAFSKSCRIGMQAPGNAGDEPRPNINLTLRTAEAGEYSRVQAFFYAQLRLRIPAAHVAGARPPAVAIGAVCDESSGEPTLASAPSGGTMRAVARLGVGGVPPRFRRQGPHQYEETSSNQLLPTASNGGNGRGR